MCDFLETQPDLQAFAKISKEICNYVINKKVNGNPNVLGI